jgi:hypothetical protein
MGFRDRVFIEPVLQDRTSARVRLRLRRFCDALLVALAGVLLSGLGAVSGKEVSAQQPQPEVSIGGRRAAGTTPGLVPDRADPATKKLPPRIVADSEDLPPRVRQAQRFLAGRGWGAGSRRPFSAGGKTGNAAAGHAAPAGAGTWSPLGPGAVATPSFGLVSGRVSAVALDPADATGNHLYIGTSGGGVWVTNNAAVTDATKVVFTPLTDGVEALNGVTDASISMGALSVQAGGTGVVLAGTGDPNDALDSYYGAGILRSSDGGNSWTLIPETADFNWEFAGEGFAGFAWSSVNPQLVVAAVSQAYEGTLVNAVQSGHSYEGLYYSRDAGVTWSLATIEDGPSAIVQSATAEFAFPDGNAATAVVWNPVRRLFVAAVRFHGYYQSSDGVTWIRMTAQPGANLTASFCPTNAGQAGSIGCPIFRGSLAVNPQTGDTFAWSVDVDNQDQGLWQDGCVIGGGACTNPTITFARQWNTSPLEINTSSGPATIANGDYNLALAAVPAGLGQGEDTWVLAGDNDLWRCSLALGCVWRNTTNATTCMSGEVAEFQHALAWDSGNPLEILVGNDGGLWRSLDAIGETGPVCSASDATHFQNLNGSLGSLAEVDSLALSPVSPYTLMTGLGVNGTAGVKSQATVDDWAQILGGLGGPVLIDAGSPDDWFVNNQDGVSIYLCSQSTACASASFGTMPVVDDADVGGDGATMLSPAPFLLDPVTSTQMLIGTCRVWRGPADGIGWSGSNAISPILDSGATGIPCNGDSLIRSMAAMQLVGGTEVDYVGMYGALTGGGSQPGHIFSAAYNPQNSSMPVWQDLTGNPVSNSNQAMNAAGLDISSIYVDSHDATGMTVYATIEGFSTSAEEVEQIYGSTDGGAHWANLTSNLPSAPVSAAVVDPQSASTVYVGTDLGVYFTTQISSCSAQGSVCWASFGTGLPAAPVTALSASLATAAAQVLTAGTYGRGVWQTALWSAGGSFTTDSASPASLTFAGQAFGTNSTPQTVTLTNTGALALTPTGILMSGDFSETDDCKNATIAVGGSCTITVIFTPTATGSRTGQMIVSADVYGGQLTVGLSGTGNAAGIVNLMPATLSFGQVLVGTTSAPLPLTAANSSGAAVPMTGLAITAPFILASNSCGTSSLAADSDCQLTIEFAPTQAGADSGSLIMTDGAGTQTVILSGVGAAPPTDLLNPGSLSFPVTVIGQISAVEPVLLTNIGDLPLTSIAFSLSGPFQIATNTCGTQLAGHAACSVSVAFAPEALGNLSGVLTVSDALRTQTVPLTGTGAKPALLSASPTSLVFSSASVGVASAPATLTITNNGGVAAANVGFQITGMNAASFSTSASTCPASLNAAISCTVQVVFTPAAAGGSAAVLTVSSATAGVTPLIVPLNGNGLNAAGINVSPAQVSFAATVVGVASATQTVTISNSSNVTASQLSLVATASFSLTASTCATSLAAGASCAVGVFFDPASVGPVTGTLIVASASIAATATVLLSGTGSLAAAIEVTPASITFPTTGVAPAPVSAPITVTVENSGTASSLSNLALAVSTGFQLVNNTCPATLGSGVSCTAGVVFAPTVAGAATGNLSVTSSSVSGGVTVPLQGTGFDFSVAFSGSSTQSVTAGQIATYTLLLTPLAGSSATFTLACASLPTNALCSFNPATETLTAGASGNVAVSVSTGTSTSAWRRARPGGWGVLSLACALLVLPLTAKRRRGTIALCLVLAIMLGGIASCAGSGGGSGGGGGGGGGSGSTPTGTYSVPFTVTSTGISHSVTATLTVD